MLYRDELMVLIDDFITEEKPSRTLVASAITRFIKEQPYRPFTLLRVYEGYTHVTYYLIDNYKTNTMILSHPVRDGAYIRQYNFDNMLASVKV